MALKQQEGYFLLGVGKPQIWCCDASFVCALSSWFLQMSHSFLCPPLGMWQNNSLPLSVVNISSCYKFPSQDLTFNQTNSQCCLFSCHHPTKIGSQYESVANPSPCRPSTMLTSEDLISWFRFCCGAANVQQSSCHHLAQLPCQLSSDGSSSSKGWESYSGRHS